MKLIYRILIPLSVSFVLILSIWAIIFYFEMIYEVNDETDEALEHYSELLIKDKLSGKQSDFLDELSNNTFNFDTISPQFAASQPHIISFDTTFYISSHQEFEPARIYKTIFKDEQGQYYQLTVSTPFLKKSDLKESILLWVVILFVSLLLLIVLINLIIYRNSLKPLYKTLNWLSDYQIGTNNVPIPSDTPVKEFSQLNNEILKYISRTEDTFEEQKLFIGKVSHEMQTPIAICQNRLELLIDQTQLSEEQLMEMAQIQHTLTYMSKLNKNLLFLTKIYNNQFPDKEKIIINDLIKNMLSDFKTVFSYLEIEVSIIEQAMFEMEMNEILATSLVSNILKNAFSHNYEKGKIEIVISNTSFSVANTGVDAPLEEDKIYKPFYYTKNRKKSSGLGLSISAAICKLYNLEIDYKYTLQTHTFLIKK